MVGQILLVLLFVQHHNLLDLLTVVLSYNFAVDFIGNYEVNNSNNNKKNSHEK